MYVLLSNGKPTLSYAVKVPINTTVTKYDVRHKPGASFSIVDILRRDVYSPFQICHAGVPGGLVGHPRAYILESILGTKYLELAWDTSFSM